jgi:L-aspartate oxidase
MPDANATANIEEGMDTDFIVVGAGVAGLRAAIELAQAGRVLVLAKQELTESATQYAQGGIAVALSDEDEISLHLQDTITAGDGLVNEAAARVLVEEGPERIQELLDWGTEFDREGLHLTFTREGAHSRSRVLHAHGDSTGREIGRALAAKARTLPNISFSEFEFSADLILDGGRAVGLCVIDADGTEHVLSASAILLATGGAGQVFRDTTNPSVATADGIAMAFRAGAELSDLEFVQFHPTALYQPGAPRFLLSEALRGEGAHLLNDRNLRFMGDYHPQEELAPRDVVARAIWNELVQSESTDPAVFLDMRHLDATHLAARFPRIYKTCLRYGVDITRDLVPIRPAAHYIMGGVRTDLHGRSSIPGLFAAGETACTGVHGANRLASNSLLEGLVFGARTGERMRESFKSGSAGLGCPVPERPAVLNAPVTADHLRLVVHNIMARCAGVVRDGDGLRQGLMMLETLVNRLPPARSRANCEAINIHEAATLIVRAAAAREESRGAHFRTDFPQHDDARFKGHSVIHNHHVRFEP